MRRIGSKLTDETDTGGKVDPLFVIFEQHLLNFQDSDIDRKSFITQVVMEYLSYLRRMKIVVPPSLENAVGQELAIQVNAMLVKKIYGNLTISEYRRQVSEGLKQTVLDRYSRLQTKAK